MASKLMAPVPSQKVLSITFILISDFHIDAYPWERILDVSDIDIDFHAHVSTSGRRLKGGTWSPSLIRAFESRLPSWAQQRFTI